MCSLKYLNSNCCKVILLYLCHVLRMQMFTPMQVSLNNIILRFNLKGPVPKLQRIFYIIHTCKPLYKMRNALTLESNTCLQISSNKYKSNHHVHSNRNSNTHTLLWHTCNCTDLNIDGCFLHMLVVLTFKKSANLCSKTSFCRTDNVNRIKLII